MNIEIAVHKRKVVERLLILLSEKEQVFSVAHCIRPRRDDGYVEYEEKETSRLNGHPFETDVRGARNKAISWLVALPKDEYESFNFKVCEPSFAVKKYMQHISLAQTELKVWL